MPVGEASFQETQYGRWITSEGWFVLNLGDAFTVRNAEKGGAAYLIEPAGGAVCPQSRRQLPCPLAR